MKSPSCEQIEQRELAQTLQQPTLMVGEQYFTNITATQNMEIF